MEVDSIDEGESSRASEFAPALIVVHPLGHSVVVAVGPELRVFDLKENSPISLSDNTGGPLHSDAIRAITFCTNGALFASAGDDKLVKIWKTDSWCCIQTVTSEKRVSAVAISNDGQFVTFADKFGVVWLVSVYGYGEGHASVNDKPVPILGHYCSIITSMKFSPDGRCIATADRDFKIRITLFPKRPLKGVHEIQSFCLGHTDFVSCLAFACPSALPGFLLSGSGDSTVRLWDYLNGCLLDTCHIGDKAGLLEPSDTNVGSSPVIADICVIGDGSLAAVAIKSLNGIVLLKCDLSAKNLSFAKVFTMEKSYIPTSLGFSSHAQQLWTIMGASNLPSLPTSQLPTRLKIVSGLSKSLSACVENDPLVLVDSEVPDGENLLLTLQGSVDVAKLEAMLASAAAAVRDSMHNMLIKKQYSVERREFRKRGRNDKKLKQ